ncbi:MAG: hypothetical protein AAFV88_12930 [Planctomycetota bacterium]
MTRCLAFVVALTCFFGSQRVDAGNDCPVFCAADRYREAVREFERHVLRARYVARCDERLTDALEDSTSRLRSAARQLNRPERICQRFVETDTLHRQVESVFFLSGVYPPDPRLEACWQAVARAYEPLAFELSQFPCYQALNSRSRANCSPNVRFRTPIRTVPSYDRFGTIAPPQTFAPQTFGPQTFGPQTFGPQTFGSQLIINGGDRGYIDRGSFAPPQVIRPQIDPRDTRSTATYTRRTINDIDQLRNAVIGAMLQRR